MTTTLNATPVRIPVQDIPWDGLHAEYVAMQREDLTPQSLRALEARWTDLGFYVSSQAGIIRQRGTVDLVDVGEPYSSADDMAADWWRNGTLRVSTLYSDGHPFWAPATNWDFRVWHDMGHITTGLGFQRMGEFYLWALKVREVRDGAGLHAAMAYTCEHLYQSATAVSTGDFGPQACTYLGPIARAMFSWALGMRPGTPIAG